MQAITAGDSNPMKYGFPSTHSLSTAGSRYDGDDEDEEDVDDDDDDDCGGNGKKGTKWSKAEVQICNVFLLGFVSQQNYS